MALAGLAITIFFVIKGIKGGIILSILTTTVLAIAVGLVDLSSIDFANNHVGAAFEDLKTIFDSRCHCRYFKRNDLC
ncbi:xanthine/uracil permease family protein [Streptococcus pneumoniae]|nr:xanthine/uracil permease family protein [Streptococcus pneumoniae]